MNRIYWYKLSAIVDLIAKNVCDALWLHKLADAIERRGNGRKPFRKLPFKFKKL